MNVVTLIGNLATDVELREVGPEKKVASFLLAVDRVSRDGGAAGPMQRGISRFAGNDGGRSVRRSQNGKGDRVDD